MALTYAGKKKKTPLTAEDSARQQQEMTAKIYSMAGFQQNTSRDPVYNMAAQFSQNFDMMGQMKNKQRIQDSGQEHPDKEDHNSSDIADKEKALTPEKEAELRKKHDSPAYTHSKRELAEGDFCDRFSSYAFNRGTLANSILDGEGEMMLTSCMKRAAGLQTPYNKKQNTLLRGNGAVERNFINQPARVIYNRDAHSAVGLVVDTIRSAVRTMDMMKVLVGGRDYEPQSPVALDSIATMKQLYPFLDLSDEDSIIADCRQRLDTIQNDNSASAAGSRKMISMAMNKAVAVKERKLSEQRKFLTKLEEMLSNARQAEKLFSSDGYAEMLAEEIFKSFDIPPDDNNKNIVPSGIISGGNAIDEEKKQNDTAKSDQTAEQKQKSGTAEKKPKRASERK